jgi:phage terminase large subunit-like protein
MSKLALEFINDVLRNEDGKPFTLFPMQRLWFENCWTLRDDGTVLYPEQMLSWIKGSGKTYSGAIELLTTLLVFGGKNAQAFCLASDLQQAQQRVFAACKQITLNSPWLHEQADITASRIVFRNSGATITALGADGAGAAGMRPTFISVDEVHTFASNSAIRLWDELIPTEVGDQKVSIRLSTSHAGYNGQSPILEQLYAKGQNLSEIAPGLRGGENMLFMWSHDPVAPHQTEGWLFKQRQLARSATQYLRQFENRWLSNEAQFIEPVMWDACVVLDQPPHPNPMVRLYVGIDASYKRDSTAVVCVAGDGDMVTLRAHRVFQPTDGNPVDFQAVEDYLLTLKQRYPNITLVYDEYQLGYLIQRLQQRGWQCERFVQSGRNLSAATQALFDLIRYKKLRVYADSKLRDAVLRAHIEEKSDGPRFVKNANEKNDLVLALAMACHRCIERHNKHVDFMYKYRAFASDFRDEDLPPLPEPKIAKPEDLPAHEFWGPRWHETMPRSNQKIDAGNEALRNFYTALNLAAGRWW